MLIPAVQPGPVCSTTWGSSSEHPPTPARLCPPYEGGARLSFPTPPCSRFKLSGAAGPLTPHAALKRALRPLTRPVPSLRASLKCFWGTEEHQPQPSRSLAHPPQLYGGEGACDQRHRGAGTSIRNTTRTGMRIGSRTGTRRTRTGIESKTGIMTRARTKTGTSPRTGTETRTDLPPPHTGPARRWGRGRSARRAPPTPYLARADVTSDAHVGAGRNRETRMCCRGNAACGEGARPPRHGGQEGAATTGAQGHHHLPGRGCQATTKTVCPSPARRWHIHTNFKNLGLFCCAFGFIILLFFLFWGLGLFFFKLLLTKITRQGTGKFEKSIICFIF